MPLDTTSIPPALIRKLEELSGQFAELDRQLSDPAALWIIGRRGIC